MNRGKAEAERERANLPALMARAQDGDRDAYSVLLEESARIIRAFLARRLQDDSEVEDVVQETLLTVHRVRHTYDPERPFLPWLFALTRRRLVDALRRQGRRPTTVSLDDGQELGVVLPRDHEHRDALNEAIAKLPEGQRDLIEMLKVQDIPVRDVARKLDMTENAVRVAAHRAIQRLRSLLGGPDGNE